MHIPFGKLPGYKRLFSDYTEDFAAVGGWYAHDPWRAESFTERLTYLDRRAASFHRALVADVLAVQNVAYGAVDAAMANIDALRSDKTAVVVAGQQAGLFGGPMYTLIKAACAIRWARHLEAVNPGWRIVPVFWIASDDHDFDEVKRFHWIGTDNKLHRCEFAPGYDVSELPVGSIRLDVNIAETFECFFSTNPGTEFTPALRGALEKAYAPGAFMVDGFARLLASWFSEQGLVLLNPMDARLKALGAPVFATAIEKRKEIFADVHSRSERLEAAGYHAQIGLPHDGTNLFVMVDGRREALRLDGARYVTESGAEFSLAGLAKMMAEEPERISPNVVVRPVYQDTILPVAASIVGPSELSYYAQISGVFPQFGMAPPVYLPRHSLTVIEHRIEKILGEIGLEWNELAGEPDDVVKRVVRGKLPDDLDEAFNTYREKTIVAGVELAAKVVLFEPTMAKPMQKMAASLHHYADDIEKKLQQAYKQKNQTWVERIERAAAALFPDRGFQERFAGPVYFLNKYGPEFAAKVLAELNPEEMGHHTIVI